METNTRTQEGNNNPSPIPSPHNNQTNNNNYYNGGIGIVQIQTSPNPRSDSASNLASPTTFVQADTSTFKQVVQMLTGSSSPSTQLDHHHHERNFFPIPPIKTFAPKKPQQGNIISSSNNSSFKLYERRNYNINNSLKNMSPSMLDFPKLTLSPVTPLTGDPFNRGSSPSSMEEEKAIAEKGFYLHPSPRDSDEPPQLLPLFPLTSPRVSESTS